MQGFLPQARRHETQAPHPARRSDRVRTVKSPSGCPWADSSLGVFWGCSAFTIAAAVARGWL
jgi:hypothetical protein